MCIAFYHYPAACLLTAYWIRHYTALLREREQATIDSAEMVLKASRVAQEKTLRYGVWMLVAV